MTSCQMRDRGINSKEELKCVELTIAIALKQALDWFM